MGSNRIGMEFFDLSYRSTFNDEPGPDDLPKWECESRIVRLGPFDAEAYCGGVYARKP